MNDNNVVLLHETPQDNLQRLQADTRSLLDRIIRLERVPGQRNNNIDEAERLIEEANHQLLIALGVRT